MKICPCSACKAYERCLYDDPEFQFPGRARRDFILPPPLPPEFYETEPVELQRVARGVSCAVGWATAVAIAAFVAIGYLLATL